MRAAIEEGIDWSVGTHVFATRAKGPFPHCPGVSIVLYWVKRTAYAFGQPDNRVDGAMPLIQMLAHGSRTAPHAHKADVLG